MPAATKYASLFAALRSGVVPESIPKKMVVGRDSQLRAVVADLATTEKGGGTFRVICASYGCGKSFFIGVSRHACHLRNYVTTTVELSGAHKLVGQGAQALLSSAICSFTTRSDKSFTAVLANCFNVLSGGTPLTESEFRTKLEPLENLASGVELRRALLAYYFSKAPEIRDIALLWLQGQLPSLADAKKIGCHKLLQKETLLNVLQGWSMYFRLCGYVGLYLFIDEGTLTAASTMTARQRHDTHDQLVNWINVLHQAQSLKAPVGIYLAVTPESLEDPKRGLQASPALRGRLTSTRDTTGPVIELSPFTAGDYRTLAITVAQMYSEGALPVVQEDDWELFVAKSMATDGGLPSIRQYLKQWIAYMELKELSPTLSREALLEAVFNGKR